MPNDTGLVQAYRSPMIAVTGNGRIACSMRPGSGGDGNSELVDRGGGS